MVDFLCSRRKLSLRTAIYKMDLRTETESCSGCIHCNISSADNDRFLRFVDRRVIIIAESIHEIIAGQILVC